MTTPSRTARLLVVVVASVALALAACGGAGEVLTSSVCAPSSTEECDDTEVHTEVDGEDDAGADAGAAAGSCLAGDEDCTDESFDGQDVARPVPLASAPSGAEPATRGATSGATGHRIEHAYLVDDDTLALTVGDNPCMLVEVDLDAPLGDRTLLDLAG